MSIPKPKRAVELEINIGGDSDQEIISGLNQILFEFETKGVRGEMTSGSPSAHWHVEIERNPEMTNERYFKELDAYLEKVKR